VISNPMLHFQALKFSGATQPSNLSKSGISGSLRKQVVTSHFDEYRLQHFQVDLESCLLTLEVSGICIDAIRAIRHWIQRSHREGMLTVPRSAESKPQRTRIATINCQINAQSCRRSRLTSIDDQVLSTDNEDVNKSSSRSTQLYDLFLVLRCPQHTTRTCRYIHVVSTMVQCFLDGSSRQA
jgi:hypothetical protein